MRTAIMRPVIKLLRAVPRWLTISLAAISAAVVLVVGQTSRNLSGWTLFWLLVAGVVFAALAIAIPQLQQWQAKQDQQLDLDLNTSSQFFAVPDYRQVDKHIEKRIEEARTACLESLPFEVEEQLEPDDSNQSSSFTFNAANVPRMPSLSVRELRKLEERQEAGEDLNSEEAAKLDAASKLLRTTVANWSATIPGLFQAPDKRTRDQYLSQVESYLHRPRVYLEELTLWNYCHSDFGSLQITLKSRSKMAFKELEVELSSEGPVEIYDPDALEDPGEAPNPPRPFGTPDRLSHGINIPYILSGADVLNYRNVTNELYGPEIELDPAHVKFGSVTPRPDVPEKLDELRVVVRARPGSVFLAGWFATATNAERKADGSFNIHVSHQDTSEELLFRIVEEEDSNEWLTD